MAAVVGLRAVLGVLLMGIFILIWSVMVLCMADDPDLGDAPPFGGKHGQRQVLILHLIAHAGHFIQLGVDEAAQGIVILVGEFGIEQFVKIVYADFGVHLVFIVAQTLVQHLFFVVLILNVADDLFHQVFNGHQASDRAIFIDYNRHMNALVLKLVQQIIQLLGFGDKVGGAHEIAHPGLHVPQAQVAQQVFGVEDADDIIDGVLIDRNARLPALHNQ